MGIQVEIVRVVQELNLSTMQTDRQLILRLPTGSEVKLTVSEEDLKQIIVAGAQQVSDVSHAVSVVSDSKSEGAVASTKLSFETTTMEDEAAVEFGGGGTQPVPKAEPQPPPTSPQIPSRRRTVTTDAAGYPVVHGTGGVDPGEIASNEGPLDEDGVGSV
jgi:hypothetical protein